MKKDLEIRPSRIPGLLQIIPRLFEDDRGSLLESHNVIIYNQAKIDVPFVQDNLSTSRLGILRGLHFQRKHPQGKLITVISGEIFDVAVDLRSGSPTFGEWAATLVSAREHNQVYLPPGLAHGFLALADDTVVLYKLSDYYHPENEDGIRWDDPTLGIEWPDIGIPPILSDKDRLLPSFDPERKYFDSSGRAS